MFDVIEHMFDVIVNEVKKYYADARKLEAKRDSLFEQRDVITILQIKTEPGEGKHAASFTCKNECTSNLNSCRECLKQNTLSFAEIFAAMIKNFQAFAKNLCADFRRAG